MLAPIRGQIAEDSGCFPLRRGISPPGLSSLDSTLDSRRGSGSRPTTRGSPSEDFLLSIETPRTSRCHPGCFTPEVQERPDAGFRRLHSKEQQAAASPKGHGPILVRPCSRAGVDPLDRRGASSAPPVLPAPGEMQLVADSAASPNLWRRLQPELADSLKVLGRPHAIWPADLCRAVRKKAAQHPGPEEAVLLQKLQLCVKQATEYAFKRGSYQVDRADGPGYESVSLSQVLSPYPNVRWFDANSSAIEGTDPDLGKAVPPPLLVTDSSCFDIVCHLRGFGHLHRDIFVVTELLEFDAAGNLSFGTTSLRPHCAQLRTDFRRFYTQAAAQLKKGKASMQQSLCNMTLPKVFVAYDVSCIRGSQGHGYPFLASPVHCHIIATALWTNRPSLRIARSDAGDRITVYQESDSAQAYQLRLELVAHAALTAAGAGPETSAEWKPALILPVLGLGGNSFHPEDAVALAFKSFRRRFTQFFHSVYVCCGDRGPNYALSDFIESAVNKSVYMMAQNDTLAAKALPWHWDKREIQLSVASTRLEKIGQVLRLGPLYVVEIREDDRRVQERRKIAEKQQVHRFGSLRGYRQKRQMEAVEEIIKAQRRQGDWPADHVHVKLGGLRDHLMVLEENEEPNMRMQVQKSLSRAEEELASPRKGENDLAYLQELLVASTASTKQRATAWLLRPDQLPRRMSASTKTTVAIEAVKRSVDTRRRASVEDIAGSLDVQVAT